MRRAMGPIIVAITLACIGGESRAGLFSGLFGRGGGGGLFGAGGGCAGGMCAAPGGVESFSAFPMQSAGFSAPMMSYAPQQMMSYGAPSTFGAGGSCYSSQMMQSAYNAPMSYSAPMSYGAPSTFGAGGCYSSSMQGYSMAYAPQQAYSVPTYQYVPPPPQPQAAPSPQTQSAPPLPSKTQPSMEYAPAPSKSPRGASSRRPETRQAIRETPERRPTAEPGCGGECCGGIGECTCGDKCDCASPPSRKKKDQVRLVNYSGMSIMNKLVDYSGLSGTRKVAQVNSKAVRAAAR